MLTETKLLEADWNEVKLIKVNENNKFSILFELTVMGIKYTDILEYDKKHIRDMKFKKFNEKDAVIIKNKFHEIALKTRQEIII